MSSPHWPQSLQALAFKAMMCLNFSHNNLSIFLFSSFTLKGFSAKVMAECSLYKEKPGGLLDPNHRASLLLFQVQFRAHLISQWISLTRNISAANWSRVGTWGAHAREHEEEGQVLRALPQSAEPGPLPGLKQVLIARKPGLLGRWRPGQTPQGGGARHLLPRLAQFPVREITRGRNSYRWV